MQTQLLNLVKNAEYKFGRIEKISFRPHRYNYVFMISRDDPADANKPYMTIIGYETPEGVAAFMHGHYDLREGEAERDFGERELN